MERAWIGIGALFGLTAAMLAAFAAHAHLDAEPLQVLRSGIDMQFWHTPALLFAAIWTRSGGRLAHAAAAFFTLGMLLFCGALYALSLGGLRLPLVAPTGGWLLFIGWILLAISALRRPQ